MRRELYIFVLKQFKFEEKRKRSHHFSDFAFSLNGHSQLGKRYNYKNQKVKSKQKEKKKKKEIKVDTKHQHENEAGN